MDEVCLKLNNSPRRHLLTIPARLLGEDCSLQGCGAVSSGENCHHFGETNYLHFQGAWRWGQFVPLKHPSVSYRPHGFISHFIYRRKKQISYFWMKYLVKIMAVESILPLQRRNEHSPILRKYECRNGNSQPCWCDFILPNVQWRVQNCTCSARSTQACAYVHVTNSVLNFMFMVPCIIVYSMK